MKTDVTGHDLLRQTRDKDPEFLAQEVMRAMGAGGVQWRYPPDENEPWRNLGFMRAGGRIPVAWPAYWPEKEHPIFWDAIGRVQMGRSGCWSWTMATALAHPTELEPHPAPPDVLADERLRAAVAAAQERFHATHAPSWLETHWPMCKPLTAYAFQRSFGSCARHLTVHFFQEAPEEWEGPLQRFHERMGLTGRSVLERHWHHAFLPMPEEA